ncbi:MAG: hypothetical protein WA432_02340 [Candidatus Babeliaceae bacterium]
MKKYLIFASALMGIIGSSQAMLVKLPDANILNNRLREDGLELFVNKTKIDQTLGNQSMGALAVLLSLEGAIRNYNKDLDPITATLNPLEARKRKIIGIILQDNPEALEQVDQYIRGMRPF